MKHTLLYNSLLFTMILMVTCSPINNSNEPKAEIDVSGKSIFYENKTFNEAVDFTKLFKDYVVSNSGKEINCNLPVTFKNCIFTKELTAFFTDGVNTIRCNFLNNLSFIDCTFEKDVNFRGIKVNNISIFENCTFLGTVDFQASTFLSEAYFNKNEFLKEVKFQNSYFTKNAVFLDSQFSEVCNFQGTVFNLQAQFGVCKFFGYTDFSLCDFRSGALFNYAEMPDRAVFNNSVFNQRADFVQSIFNDVSMKACTFTGSTNFDKITIGKLLNLESSIFYLPPASFDPMYQNQIKLDNIITMLN